MRFRLVTNLYMEIGSYFVSARTNKRHQPGSCQLNIGCLYRSYGPHVHGCVCMGVVVVFITTVPITKLFAGRGGGEEEGEREGERAREVRLHYSLGYSG
jgi:hypothetical protein